MLGTFSGTRTFHPSPKLCLHAQVPVAKTSSNVRKTSVTASASTAPTSQTNKRRSNAVQEVEKLRGNREKRRAQQAQVYESQERQKSKDTGTPHWEFLNMIEEFKEDLEINPLHEGVPIANHQITVCIRKRPLSNKEVKSKEIDVITIPSKDTILVHEPKTKVDLTKYLENQNSESIGTCFANGQNGPRLVQLP